MLKLVCENGNWYYELDSRRAELKTADWFDYWGRVLKPFESDRYELVEKKDWKLNQLKKKLEEKKQSTDYYSKVIDKEIALLAEYQKEVEDLEKEIKELEQ